MAVAITLSRTDLASHIILLVLWRSFRASRCPPQNVILSAEAKMKFYKHSEGGRTIFMAADNDANEALKRVGEANVPAGVSYYERTTVCVGSA